MDTTASATRDRISQFNKDARDEIRDVLDKTADKVQPAADSVAANAKLGLSKVGDAYDSASTVLAARGKQLGVAYDSAAKSGAEFVRERPATSLLIAAAVGYGISRLVRAAAK